SVAGIVEPSGHVFVVGGVDGGTDVNGGVDVDGVNDWVHDGSVGFFIQSTCGGVPEVQLFTQVDPVPDPPDDADDGHVVLSLQVDAAGVAVIACSFASPRSQSLVFRFLSGSVTALLSARSHFW